MKKLIGLAVAVAAAMVANAVEGERMVFAHYMTCFYKDVETYKKEILIAQQYGVEGWALNCGNWKRKDPKTGEWRPHEGYVQASSNVFAAAEALGTGFKVFFSPDGSKETLHRGNHPDMGVMFYKHPNLFRYGGRPFISGWAGNTRLTNKYVDFRRELAARGVGDYLIVPHYGVSTHTMYETFDLVENDIFRDPNFVCDGIFFFGCDNTVDEFIDRQKLRGAAGVSTFEVEYHKRFATPFAAFILTLIGVSLSCEKRKGGMGASIGVGIALSFTYILFQTVSSTFAINAGWPAMFAVWLPNIIFAIIAAVLYRRTPQ